MDDDLIAAHRDVPMLMPFLHLPVQSGSDRVLAAMNREHTRGRLPAIVDRLREARPDIALSSDFIVGHPGETAADFAATIDLVRDDRFRPGLQLQILAPSRHAGRGAPTGAGGREGPPACRSSKRCCASSRPASTPPASASTCLFCSPGRAATPARSPGARPIFSRCTSMRAASLIGTESLVRIGAALPNSSVWQPSTRSEPPLEPHRRVPGSTSARAPAQIGGKAITLQFHDNTLLPLLLGDHDRHLVRLEQGLGVRLSCRGNRVAIAGDPARVDAAQAVLEASGAGWSAAKASAAPKSKRPSAWPKPNPTRDCRCPICRRSAPAAARSAPAAPARPTYMDALARHEMVFGVGPAGTGKTYLAVAQAVAMLQAGKVDRIVLSRPAVEAGERLGFLPGDMKEKVDPYLRPLYDALHDMMPGEQVIRRMAQRRDRGGAARLHARPHPGACLCHPR